MLTTLSITVLEDLDTIELKKHQSKALFVVDTNHRQFI